MKKPLLIPLVMAMLLSSPLSQASNIIRMQAPIQGGHASEPAATWTPWQDSVSEWANAGEVSGCSNWAPLASTIASGTVFTQTATDCQQSQQRTVQATERNTDTLVVRNAGAPTVESQTVTTSSTRSATGTSTISATAVFVINVGNISTQWGYMGNTSTGSIVSSSNPSYSLNYTSLGYQSMVLIGLNGTQLPASRYDSVKIQMLDSSGAVFYTLSSSAITDIYPYSPGYVGWYHTAADYAAAKVAKRFIVTLNFK